MNRVLLTDDCYIKVILGQYYRMVYKHNGNVPDFECNSFYVLNTRYLCGNIIL